MHRRTSVGEVVGELAPRLRRSQFNGTKKLTTGKINSKNLHIGRSLSKGQSQDSGQLICSSKSPNFGAWISTGSQERLEMDVLGLGI